MRGIAEGRGSLKAVARVPASIGSVVYWAGLSVTASREIRPNKVASRQWRSTIAKMATSPTICATRVGPSLTPGYGIVRQISGPVTRPTHIVRQDNGITATPKMENTATNKSTFRLR